MYFFQTKIFALRSDSQNTWRKQIFCGEILSPLARFCMLRTIYCVIKKVETKNIFVMSIFLAPNPTFLNQLSCCGQARGEKYWKFRVFCVIFNVKKWKCRIFTAGPLFFHSRLSFSWEFLDFARPITVTQKWVYSAPNQLMFDAEMAAPYR